MRVYFLDNANMSGFVGCQSAADWKTTYYIRDAQGNPMATYSRSSQNQEASYKLIERPIYGSSRVGIDNYSLEFIDYTAPTNGITNHVLGLKQYELSNHLGNVLTTISDKKIPIDNNGLIDHYVADITSVSDSAKCYFETYPYKVQNLHWLIPNLKSLEFVGNELLRIHNRCYYPFGSPMDGRTFGSFRYGFNGKENDNEVKGAGSQQDYGMRIYDTRMGRFLSIDPLAKSYPWYTPYQFAGNKPIWAIDVDGLEEHILSDNNSVFGPYSHDYIGKYNSLIEITHAQYIEQAQNGNYAGAINVIRINYQLYKLGKPTFYDISSKNYSDGLIIGESNELIVNPSYFLPILNLNHFNFTQVLAFSHEHIHLYQRLCDNMIGVISQPEREFLAWEFMANQMIAIFKEVFQIGVLSLKKLMLKLKE